MNVMDIPRYLVPLPATKKMDKNPKAGIRITRNICVSIEEDMMKDVHPNNDITASEYKSDTIINIFCFEALLNKEKGTICTDASGVLPVMSLNRKQYHWIA